MQRRASAIVSSCLSLSGGLHFLHHRRSTPRSALVPQSLASATEALCVRAVDGKRFATTIPGKSTTSGAGALPSGAICELCDEEVEGNWNDHSETIQHRARHALCSASVNPQKHEALMTQLWEHIQLDFAQVDDVNQKKIERRQRRLRGSLQHLAKVGALQHALAFWSTTAPPSSPSSSFGGGSEQPTLCISPKAKVFRLLGAAQLYHHVVDRVSRLYPQMAARDLEAVCQFVCSPSQIAELYEAVGVSGIEAIPQPRPAASSSLASATEENADTESKDAEDDIVYAQQQQQVDREPTREDFEAAMDLLSEEEKCTLFLCTLGELQAFTTQESQFQVGDSAVARQIVHNVLAGHSMENMVSELVHMVLQRVVNEGTPVWVQYCENLQHMKQVGLRAPPPLELAKGPTAAAAGKDKKEPVQQQQQAQEDLENVISTLRTMVQQEKQVHHTIAQLSTGGKSGRKSSQFAELVRHSTLNVTVSNPKNKSTIFAPTLPKVSSKKN